MSGEEGEFLSLFGEEEPHISESESGDDNVYTKVKIEKNIEKVNEKSDEEEMDKEIVNDMDRPMSELNRFVLPKPDPSCEIYSVKTCSIYYPT